ncbi:MAG: hypothetical protein RIQ33_2465 [Bacteroidota bacterium]|jgi:4-hydroxybenzoate polyprenyltransferase
MLRYIAKYNIHLGLAAAISGLSYCVLLNSFINYQLLMLLCSIQFLTTVAAYNYLRIRNKLTWQVPLIVIFLVSFYFDFYFQVALLSVGALTFFYQLPLKIKLGFRFFPFLKPFIIGFCWACIIVLLTNLSDTNGVNSLNVTWAIFVIKFLEISALSIANDLLHIPKDKMNGVKTFPIAYGLWVSKLSIVVIASLQLIIAFVASKQTEISTGFALSSAVSFALIMLSVLLIHFKKNKGVELLLDVIIGIEALLLLAFSVLY